MNQIYQSLAAFLKLAGKEERKKKSMDTEINGKVFLLFSTVLVTVTTMIAFMVVFMVTVFYFGAVHTQ